MKRAKDKYTDRWLSVLPGERRLAEDQAAWELGHRICIARSAGATLQQIALSLGVTDERVRQIQNKSARRAKHLQHKNPLQRWLDDFDMRDLAKPCQRRNALSLPPSEIANRLRDVAERKQMADFWKMMGRS